VDHNRRPVVLDPTLHNGKEGNLETCFLLFISTF
jgi:hypothetical protein